MALALPEWTVLALLREEPRHGFAIAALTAAGGALGRVWSVPRPMVYRALGRLEEAELIRPLTVESGPGPQRTVYDLTETGRACVDEWLHQPAEHVRQLRSHLLVKLALLHRRALDPTGLLTAQRAVLARVVAATGADRGDGFDAVLLAWRHTNASAALRFVDDLVAGATP
ncbi:PadR family transcriptional regulator [Umezawaea tangerina]|uniref:PadR family transcriptional regulator n=1 Tax=Umezawaea tangerina TaxID=84725 RepID=A0A2T0SWL8_9PSEU|nr:PadR family transcriptional regulator [Umezawaea tangerina]PRY37811.1 PadR family transcriptional regulator [Umezawaea tangerina]